VFRYYYCYAGRAIRQTLPRISSFQFSGSVVSGLLLQVGSSVVDRSVSLSVGLSVDDERVMCRFDQDVVWVVGRVDPRNRVLFGGLWVQIPHGEEQIWGNARCSLTYKKNVVSAICKNDRAACRLGW